MVLALFTATVSCVYTLFQTHKNVCITYVQLFCVSIVPPPAPPQSRDMILQWSKMAKKELGGHSLCFAPVPHSTLDIYYPRSTSKGENIALKSLA